MGRPSVVSKKEETKEEMKEEALEVDPSACASAGPDITQTTAEESGEAEPSLDLQSLYVKLAADSVDNVVNSVIGLIKKGEVKVSAPKMGWDEKKMDRSKAERIEAKKRYTRITRLLNKADMGDLNAQEELKVLAAAVEKDSMRDGAAEDVMLQDMVNLLHSRDQRAELMKQRQLEKKRQNKMREQQRIRREQREAAMAADEEKRRRWEAELMDKMSKDKAELRNERSKRKKAEKEKEIQMRKIIAKKIREVRPEKPLHTKILENYEHNVLLPELEKQKAYLKKKRDIMQQPTIAYIKEHEKKFGNRPKHQARPIPVYEKVKVYRNENAHKIVIEELEKDKNKKMWERRKAEEGRNYADMVKEKHRPACDPVKKMEIERKKKDVTKEAIKDMRDKGKQHQVKSRNFLKEGVRNVVGDDDSKIGKQRPLPPDPVPPPKPKNYLADLKKQRKARPSPDKSIADTGGYGPTSPSMYGGSPSNKAIKTKHVQITTSNLMDADADASAAALREAQSKMAQLQNDGSDDATPAGALDGPADE